MTTTTPSRYATGDTREAIIASARELLDWLEANPHIPMRAWGLDILVGAEGRDGVDALAAQMGVTAEHTSSAHRAVKRFGPVAYVAYAANLEVTR